MKKQQFRSFLAGVAACFAVSAAHASVENVVFQTLLSKKGPNPGAFAEMSISSVDSKTFGFVLSTFDLDRLFFERDVYLSWLAVDTTPDLNRRWELSDPSDVSGGVDRVKAEKGTGNGPGSWDMRFEFGSGSNRLSSNETVSWKMTFAKEIEAMDFAAQVKGVNGNPWYGEVAAPVPEPGGVAMILSGLALCGLMVRRRSGDAASRMM